MADRCRKLLLAFGLCLALAHGRAIEAVVDRLVAVVNDELITASEVVAEEHLGVDLLAEVLPSSRPADGLLSFDQGLQRLIDRRILLQEARAMGVGVSEQEAASAVESLIDQGRLPPETHRSTALTDRVRDELTVLKLINREVRSKLVVSSEDIEAYYRTYPGRFTSPVQFRISQIVFRAPDGTDADTLGRKRQEAETLRDELAHGADFAALAKRHSDGPEAAKGGDLGVFRPGELLPAIDRAVASMEEGAVSPVLTTPIGFHLIKLTEKRAGRVKPLEDVRNEIEDLVYQEQTAERYRRWLRQLRQRAHIDVK